ncbi:MAG: helix-turn-helix domain-containing protein [Oscillospiraceae bacterium]
MFLVEDEIVVREGLRNNIDWEQYGFTYIGDAADGEMALPMIREIKPDVLITDIRMPFMDGLTLSTFVRKELPNTKIAIISGYDDFSYAQQAIHIGVEQYLLKPITKAKMIEVLTELREKFDNEAGQKNYLQQFLQEAQEYEQFSRRRFFEQLTAGSLSVAEIYETAEQLNIDINAQSYNIVVLFLNSVSRSGETPDRYTDALAALQERLSRLFLAFQEYILFRWSMTTYVILVKGNRDQIEARTANCVENIRRRCDEYEGEVDWYVAAGRQVQRLSAISGCFAETNQIISYRHMCPNEHILTAESLENWKKSSVANGGLSTIDPELVKKFLTDGTQDEVDLFLVQLLGNNGDEALKSAMFCLYFSMTVYLKTIEFVETLGCCSDEFLTPDIRTHLKDADPSVAKDNVRHILKMALQLREQESTKHYRDTLAQALEFIDRNYSDNGISLNVVAKEVNISPSYFSAVFSQEVGQTFVEYLTQKRMEAARRMLQQTDMRSSEIACAVGYKDPHYFSYLFRKTQGCTPRDYRGGGKNESVYPQKKR